MGSRAHGALGGCGWEPAAPAHQQCFLKPLCHSLRRVGGVGRRHRAVGALHLLDEEERQGVICDLMDLSLIWASLIAQLVKNPPAMRETWVRFLGQEDPLVKGKATPVFWPGESHGQYNPRGSKESDLTERLSLYSRFLTFPCGSAEVLFG